MPRKVRGPNNFLKNQEF
jgi:hypothetical protein